MNKPTVFISYSHRDEDWKDQLVTQLAVLEIEDILNVWDDREIEAGTDWKQNILDAIQSARVALLLVSADFLTSKFIRGTEIPLLLERAGECGLTIFPVIIRPCVWQAVKWLSAIQVRPIDGRPLSSGEDYQIETDLAAIAKEVAEIIRLDPSDTHGPAPDSAPPEVPEQQAESPAQHIPEQEVLEMIEHFKSEDTYVRREAVKRAEYLGMHAVPALMLSLTDKHPYVRRLSAESLGRVGTNAKEAIPALVKALNDDNPQIRQSITEALGKIGRESEVALPGLKKALDDEVVNVRRSAVLAMMRVGRPAVPLLIDALKEDDIDIRQMAAEGLGKVGPGAREASLLLAISLSDRNQDVRRAAADALERIGQDAISALRDTYYTADREAQQTIASVLERIQRSVASPRPVAEGEYPSKGDILDDTYRILKEIGRGAEAAVYKATVVRSVPLFGLDEGDFVIIKYYHPNKNKEKEGQLELARWFRGYQLTKDRPIDGLRRVFDHKDKWVAVLQWVPGETLDEIIANSTGQPPGKEELRALVTSFLRILDALIQINRRGLVFRDLKPQNVVVTTTSDNHQTWTLIDTGLVTEIGYDGASSLTTSTTVLGTPLFGAPELLDDQAMYSKESEAVDIYSVGSTLYKIVTERDMFSGSLLMILRKKLLAGTHDLYLKPETLNPAVDEKLSEIIQGCVKFRPEDRYPNLQLVYNDCKLWLQRQTPAREEEARLFYDVFITYASPDRKEAEVIYKQLSPSFKVFLDDQRLESGGCWPDEIRKVQEKSRVTVALISRYTNKAQYQMEEISRAVLLSRENFTRHIVIPVYLESIEPPYGLAVHPGLRAEEFGSLGAAVTELKRLIPLP
jgi:HEAT repeat protein/serine/threonine protein kinase